MVLHLVLSFAGLLWFLRVYDTAMFLSFAGLAMDLEYYDQENKAARKRRYNLRSDDSEKKPKAIS